MESRKELHNPTPSLCFVLFRFFFFLVIHKHSENSSIVNSCIIYITTRTHSIRVAKQNDRTIDNEVYEIPSNPQVGEERKDLKTNYQNRKETENYCPLVFQNILNTVVVMWRRWRRRGWIMEEIKTKWIRSMRNVFWTVISWDESSTMRARIV